MPGKTMDIFNYFAVGNRVMNDRLFKAFSLCSTDTFIKPMNCYYQSISGICDHIYVADVVFLRDILNSLENPIKDDALFRASHKYLVREIEDYADYKVKRRYLDQLIIDSIESIYEDDLWRTVYITTNIAGDKTSNTLYIVLSHYFNHQIHHRGNISQLLDEMGIENDISDMYSLE